MDWSQVRPLLEATYSELSKTDYTTGEDVFRALGREPDDGSAGLALQALHTGGDEDAGRATLVD